jgi:hypothetical protein
MDVRWRWNNVHVYIYSYGYQLLQKHLGPFYSIFYMYIFSISMECFCINCVKFTCVSGKSWRRGHKLATCLPS